MGLFGMILTKETYIIHVGCAVIAIAVAWVSHKITPATETRRAVQRWDWADLIAVLAVGLAALVIFYTGTFFNWAGLKGLFETFEAWFATGHNGNGHEKPWWYWLMLIGRYEAAVAVGLLACVLCQLFKDISIRYLAIYGVGSLMAYSIVAYKTPWCIISIVWPLLLVSGAAFSLVPAAFRKVGKSPSRLSSASRSGRRFG
jgi:predicted membrane-bound mannosyltransferase